MSGRRHLRYSRVVVAACVMLLALIGRAQLHAHELGLTRATVTFAADRTYTVEVLVDPESLLAKLEILSGRSPSAGVPVNELPARIEALSAILRERVVVLFDGVPQQPELAYVPGPPVPVTDPATPAMAAPATAPATAATATAGTATLRFSGRVPGGARAFQINYGLVLGSYALTIKNDAGSAPITNWVAGGQNSDAIDLTRGLVPLSRWAVAKQYLVLGFEHILPKGLDHILFVLGIFLLSPAWRPVLWQVTTFTIAHSITLGLTIYGIVSLPPAIVEPLIALSITYVAIENLFTSTLKPWRIALVFGFGLLHGMGFAGVLSELGLPRSEFFTALVTFNIGVEAGQLAVIALALFAVGWWRRTEAGRYRRWVVVPASVLIALCGAYWTIVRTLGIG
jgi:hydrogenase/urease accessory protein HupE